MKSLFLSLSKRITHSLVLAILMVGISTARADNFTRHNEARFGIELNLLWFLRPISTYELKLWARIDDSLDAIMGFGDQDWTYEGTATTPGHMNSQALILGIRGHLFRSGAVVEFDNWIAHDKLKQKDGTTFEGYSVSHEFFGGYQAYLGRSDFSLVSGLNAGFWSYKSYETPHDDRFSVLVLPKLSVDWDLARR